MKEIKNELRMWLAEKLLSWSFSISPENEEGQKLRNQVLIYFLDKIKESED